MMTRPLARLAVGALAGVMCTGMGLSAQAPGPSARHQPSPLIRVGRLIGAPVTESFGRRANADTVEVIGLVQNQEGALVPNAGRVQLRDLDSGEVIATADVNSLAQFTLRGLPPGLYASELIGSSGVVIASSAAFTAVAGELIQIAHTLPVSPLRGLAGVLRSATSLALGAAAASGVRALSPGAPVTPGS